MIADFKTKKEAQIVGNILGLTAVKYQDGWILE